MISPIIIVNKQIKLDIKVNEISLLNVAKVLFINNKRSMRIVMKSNKMKMMIDVSIAILFEG